MGSYVNNLPGFRGTWSVPTIAPFIGQDDKDDTIKAPKYLDCIQAASDLQEYHKSCRAGEHEYKVKAKHGTCAIGLSLQAVGNLAFKFDIQCDKVGQVAKAIATYNMDSASTVGTAQIYTSGSSVFTAKEKYPGPIFTVSLNVPKEHYADCGKPGISCP